jgi:hypothetical protein
MAKFNKFAQSFFQHSPFFRTCLPDLQDECVGNPILLQLADFYRWVVPIK